MTLDPGSLGTLNNANATAMIQHTISRFTAVPHMALPLITFSDPFPTDITSANLSDLWRDGNWIRGNGITPVIFDSDGSIIHELFCAPNDPCERFVGSLGGVKMRTGASIQEGFIILNGLFINGIEGDANEELLPNEMLGIVLHEMGHMLGLSHSQVNQFLSPDRPHIASSQLRTGTSVIDFGSFAEPHTLLLQRDGKMIVAGSINTGWKASTFAISRLLPDGRLDLKFGHNGKITGKSHDEDTSEEAKAVAIQLDNKIIVAGFGYGGLTLVRYLPNGTLDPLFAKKGEATITFEGYITKMTVSVLPDEKILVAGVIRKSDKSGFILARYLTNGKLDPSFGEGGKVIHSRENEYLSVYVIVIQPDGKTWVAGAIRKKGAIKDEIMVTRYQFDGRADLSFGNDGIVVHSFFKPSTTWDRRDIPIPRHLRDHFRAVDEADKASDLSVREIMLKSDGRIFVMGWEHGKMVFLQCLPDGNPDLTFGKRIDEKTNGFSSRGVLVQPDGNILVVRSLGKGFAVTRYHPDGNMDLSFGQSGQVISPIGNISNIGWPHPLAIQPDRKIVVMAEWKGDFVVTRYLSSGLLDTTFGKDKDDVPRGPRIPQIKAENKRDKTFGTEGRVQFDDHHFKGFILQQDGKIVVGDSSVLTRYLSNGRLDTTFGDGGKVETKVNITDFEVMKDEKILVAGHIDEASGFILRYLPNGILDPTFGEGGRTDVVANKPYDRYFHMGMGIYPDGKIVVAGFKYIGSSGNFTITHYLSNGKPDTTFVMSGKIVYAGDFNVDDMDVRVVKIQPDGGIIVAGEVGADGSYLVMVRYKSNGLADITFGKGRIVYIPLGLSANFFIQPDGKILIAGPTERHGDPDVDIVRYRTNGDLDLKFGRGGHVIPELGECEDAHPVSFQPDGKLMVACLLGEERYLIRYLMNGKVDTTFWGGKPVKIDTKDVDDYIRAVAFHPDGAMLVATRGLLARYTP